MNPELIYPALIFAILILSTLLVFLLNRQRWRLWHIIQRGDSQKIESARSWVTPQLIPYLMKKYWQTSDWTKKRSIVELLQDQSHPEMPKLMLDFLRVPVGSGDEQTELAQAIALGFIDERYDRFMEYYNDRNLLARDVRAVLGQHGFQSKTPPKAPPTAPVRTAADTSPNASPNQRLINTVAANDLPAVQQALRDGANLNAYIGKGNYQGCSALIFALLSKHFEIAEFLIDQGADIHFTRSDLKGKFQPGRGQTALWWAANHGHLPLAEALIRRGADVNTPDHHGGTPLTTASSSGQHEMVQYLIDHGADIHATISDGRKAFHLAVTNGHVPVVEILLKAGNDPNETGGSGYTPLMVAAENNFYELAELLIQHGADVNAVHSGPGIYIALRGWTPLVFSVHAGLVRMTKMLIVAGADPRYRVPSGQRWDGKSMTGGSLLSFAQGKRAESIKKLLIGHGAQE